jgi:hypothetical protein
MKMISVSNNQKSCLIRMYDDRTSMYDYPELGIRSGDDISNFYKLHKEYNYETLHYYGKYNSKKEVVDSLIGKNKFLSLLITKFDLCESNT